MKFHIDNNDKKKKKKRSLIPRKIKNDGRAENGSIIAVYFLRLRQI